MIAHRKSVIFILGLAERPVWAMSEGAEGEAESAPRKLLRVHVVMRSSGSDPILYRTPAETRCGDEETGFARRRAARLEALSNLIERGRSGSAPQRVPPSSGLAHRARTGGFSRPNKPGETEDSRCVPAPAA
jgi:hypothetical protein